MSIFLISHALSSQQAAERREQEKKDTQHRQENRVKRDKAAQKSADREHERASNRHQVSTSPAKDPERSAGSVTGQSNLGAEDDAVIMGLLHTRQPDTSKYLGVTVRERQNGDKEWLKDGKLHRDDGPAVECVDGYKAWYKNGLRHRDDGPATEDQYGNKEWFVNGQSIRAEGPRAEAQAKRAEAQEKNTTPQKSPPTFRL